MKISEITAVIEEVAPLRLQESYDNSGLIVGDPDAEVTCAVIAVDITEEVMDEAERIGAQMVISHHPIIFHSIKRLTGADQVQRIVARAIRNGIALYACHTNLDSVHGGLSYRVADLLGLQELEILEPIARLPEDRAGFGVTGTLARPVESEEFLRILKKALNLKVIRHSDICRDVIRKVSICTGSGGSLIDKATQAGADIYIAADFKYNDFIDADGRLIVADIGHFESEYCAIDLLYEIIKKKIPTFALQKSENSRNPVNYLF